MIKHIQYLGYFCFDIISGLKSDFKVVSFFLHYIYIKLFSHNYISFNEMKAERSDHAYYILKRN